VWSQATGRRAGWIKGKRVKINFSWDNDFEADANTFIDDICPDECPPENAYSGICEGCMYLSAAVTHWEHSPFFDWAKMIVEISLRSKPDASGKMTTWDWTTTVSREMASRAMSCANVDFEVMEEKVKRELK
jgi:hypothetical protein